MNSTTRDTTELSDVANLFDDPEAALEVLNQFSRNGKIVRADGKSVGLGNFYEQLSAQRGESPYHVNVLAGVLETLPSNPAFSESGRSRRLPTLDFYDNARDEDGQYQGRYGKFNPD
jgi:hypothetical protein